MRQTAKDPAFTSEVPAAAGDLAESLNDGRGVFRMVWVTLKERGDGCRVRNTLLLAEGVAGTCRDAAPFQKTPRQGY